MCRLASSRPSRPDDQPARGGTAPYAARRPTEPAVHTTMNEPPLCHWGRAKQAQLENKCGMKLRHALVSDGLNRREKTSWHDHGVNRLGFRSFWPRVRAVPRRFASPAPRGTGQVRRVTSAIVSATPQRGRALTAQRLHMKLEMRSQRELLTWRPACAAGVRIACISSLAACCAIRREMACESYSYSCVTSRNTST